MTLTKPDDPVLATVPEGYTIGASSRHNAHGGCVRVTCDTCNFWCETGDWERDQCNQQVADSLVVCVHQVGISDSIGGRPAGGRGCAVAWADGRIR